MRLPIGMLAAAVALACSVRWAPAGPAAPQQLRTRPGMRGPNGMPESTATVAAQADVTAPRPTASAAAARATPTRRAIQGRPPIPSTRAPTTARPVTPLPTPDPPFYSGGLGLRRTDWESSHGPPSASNGEDAGQYGEGWEATFLGGNVARLDRGWEPSPVELPEARRMVGSMLPAAAILLRSYMENSETAVDTFSSASLVARFAANPAAWAGGPPGRFTIVYHYHGGTARVLGLTIATGDPP